MSRLRDQRGFTLIELLVSMGLTMVLMTAVITVITVFLNDSRYDGLRDQAQNDSRSLVDRMSHELRNAAQPSSTIPGLLERASTYDIMFETVDPLTVYGGTNSLNEYRVRYCLDSSSTLWRQTKTWTGSSPPAVPSSTACPDTSSSDFAQTSGGSPCCKQLTDVTNEVDPTFLKPLFIYGPLINGSAPPLAQIQDVQMNLVTDLNPGHLPGPSPQLTTGVFLRNENSAPIWNYAPTISEIGNGSGTASVTLNGSGAYDPNGQTLTYQWYANSGSTACASASTGPSSGLLTNGTTQVYNAGTYSTGAQETFSLVVTDTAGLTACNSWTGTL